jgi:hypothetical protein
LNKKQEAEKNISEKEMDGKFESAKIELNTKFSRKAEDGKSLKRQEIAKKYESQEYQFEEDKNNDSEKQENKLIVQAPTQSNENFKAIEQTKTNYSYISNGSKARQRRGFWEAAEQIRVEFINLFYLRPKDDSEENTTSPKEDLQNQENENLKPTSEEKEMKKKSQGTSDDDVSSITDKF